MLARTSGPRACRSVACLTEGRRRTGFRPFRRMQDLGRSFAVGALKIRVPIHGWRVEKAGRCRLMDRPTNPDRPVEVPAQACEEQHQRDHPGHSRSPRSPPDRDPVSFQASSPTLLFDDANTARHGLRDGDVGCATHDLSEGRPEHASHKYMLLDSDTLRY